ncbi:MAG TPA: DMT family protein [Gemmataceae bacterium]|nr:DMT family protein [Gemmataceae bacterium]
MRTVLLLILSNTFMTMAWYGHLKFPRFPLLATILLSWLIALPEYALQVPANRLGHAGYNLTPTQLKIIQEVVSLTVFAVFAFLYFREVPTWRTLLAFVLIAGAVFLALPTSFSGPKQGAAVAAPTTETGGDESPRPH